jgi:hypothetical protein
LKNSPKLSKRRSLTMMLKTKNLQKRKRKPNFSE